MLRQLCIKSSTDQQSTEQIQGYVGWLKEQENGENRDEEEKQRLLEYFRAQQVQAQVRKLFRKNFLIEKIFLKRFNNPLLLMKIIGNIQ